MITRIREVRKAKGMTLEQVGARCVPPTTAQTIGRLETGTRTVSVKWLNRIAAALDVTAAELVDMPGQEALPVAALLDHEGAHAPSRPLRFTPPLPAPGQVAIAVRGGVGDYRAGDQIWCDRITAEALAGALNRDILVPRPGGRFLFGRLIGRENGMVHILPSGPGARQQVMSDPPWAAVAVRLVRSL
ncbi:helix-turn-helix domain-containing protein [Sphingobium aquiterrae]|uniref:helix-turn-helix domain-containing protein n=1 Tax=Sphingobium aquiterrae TaxID=2038656 RepID=UPI00301A02F7